MERNAFINGKNIWSTWGAELMDGALEAILTPPPVKDYIENDSRLEHGIQITSSPEICKMDSRELSLPFFITGNSQSDYLDKYSSFVSELVKGKIALKIPALGRFTICTICLVASMEATGNAGESLWSNLKNPIRATGKILYEN